VVAVYFPTAEKMGNWDFDGDEVLFFLVASILGVIGLCQWYWRLARSTRLGEHTGGRRLLLALTPPAALAGLYFVLQHWADPKYVVGQLDYILLFMAGGLAWLMLTRSAIPLLGIAVRDDAIERRNTASAVAACGAMLGTMAIYAACNVGAGPTIWTTIFPALVATAAWLVLWLIVELTTRVSEDIAIERDTAAGVRQAGWSIATGLILGRAMAGDWTAWSDTFDAFGRLGWPALILAAAVVPLHWALRPTPSQPRRSTYTAGVIPATILIGVAFIYLVWLGPADIGKHVITYDEYMKQR
jgi:uncharacterized membrane protein YjfL (UPF0719 family)